MVTADVSKQPKCILASRHQNTNSHHEAVVIFNWAFRAVLHLVGCGDLGFDAVCKILITFVYTPVPKKNFVITCDITGHNLVVVSNCYTLSDCFLVCAVIHGSRP